jgi:hypothetical protein
MVRLAALVAVALGLALATAGSAMACSCIAVAPSTKLKQSRAAVTVRLLEVRSADFVYRIGRVVKGPARLETGRRLVVRSQLPASSCRLSNSQGAVLGLFLRRAEGRWTAGACDEIRAGQMRRLGRQAGPRRAVRAAACV